MMATKYQATITQIGPLVSEFTDAGILVFFGANAPEELAEFSILHDGDTLHAPIEPGDVIRLGDESLKVLAVGNVANSNLKNLGHLVLKCNGSTTPEMPGDVCTEARSLPTIVVGMLFKIY